MKRNRSLKPPRGLFLSTRLIYDAQLSPSLKETLFQLMALAWGRDDHVTPVLSYTMLEHLTGKDVRTLHGHVAALQSYHAALRLQPVARGTFMISLSGWLFDNDTPLPAGEPSGETLQSHDEDVEEEESADIPNPERILPPPSDADAGLPAGGILAGSKPAGGKPSASGGRPPLTDVVEALTEAWTTGGPMVAPGRSGAGAGAYQSPYDRLEPGPVDDEQAGLDEPVKELTGELREKILEVGVFTGLLRDLTGVIVRQGYTGADLLALINWCSFESPGNPAPLFVTRLRLGARPPAVYRQPPCPRCGMYGEHDPQCAQRYLAF